MKLMRKWNVFLFTYLIIETLRIKCFNPEKEILAVDIENHATCEWDKLELIFADENVITICGRNLEDPRWPQRSVGPGPVRIRFLTDGSTTGQGWVLGYSSPERVPNFCELNECQNGAVCSEAAEECICNSGFDGIFCELDVNECLRKWFFMFRETKT